MTCLTQEEQKRTTMKITKDNVKLGQILYRSTDGAECPISFIDDNDADIPIRVKTPEGFDWVGCYGEAVTGYAFFTFDFAEIQTIIERLQSHDWSEDSEDKLRKVWAIVGGGE
jgi:hypothetical protein